MKYSNELSSEFYTTEKCFITEIMNTPDQTGMSIARARVAPGVTTNVHFLKNTLEYYYIISGEGLVFLDQNEGVSVVPGDVVAIQAGQHQSIKNIGEFDLVFICIFSPRFEIGKYVEVK